MCGGTWRVLMRGNPPNQHFTRFETIRGVKSAYSAMRLANTIYSDGCRAESATEIPQRKKEER